MGNLKQIIIFLDPKFTINPINKEIEIQSYQMKDRSKKDLK